VPTGFVGQAWVQVSPSFTDFQRELSQEVNKAVSAVKPKPIQVGLEVDEKKSSAIGGALSKVGDKAMQIGKSAGQALATGFTVAAGAATGLTAASVKAGISYNTLYQKSNAAMKTVLGSQEASRKMMTDVMAFAKTSPFPRQAFIEATQQMLGFGIQSKKVIPYLTSIQDAVAATGGGAQDIAEITTVFSKMQAEGKVTARTLMELGGHGIDAAAMIGSSMGKSGAEIREEIHKGTLDAGKALDALAAGMEKRYGGAAANVKNTWTGATDRVKGALRDIGSAIVEPFISKEGGGLALTWANKFADLLRAIEPLIKPIVDLMVKQLTPAFQKVTDFLTHITKSVKEFGKQGGQGIADVAKHLGGLAPVLAPIAGFLLKVGGGQLAGIFGPLAPIIKTVTGALNPFVSILLSLVATSPEFRKALMDIGTQAMALLKPIMGLVDMLSGQLGPVIAAVVPIISDIFQALIQSVDELLPVLTPILKMLGPVLTNVLKSLSPIIGVVAYAIYDLVASLSGPLGQVLNTVMKVLVGILPFVAQLANVVGKVLLVAFEAVMPFLRQLFQIIADLISQLLPVIIPLVKTLAGIISRVLTRAVNVLAPILVKVGDVLGKVLAAVLPVVIELIAIVADVVGKLLDALAPLIDAVFKVAGVFLGIFVKVLESLLPIILKVVDVVDILIVDLANSLMPIIPTIAKLFQAIATALSQVWEALAPIVDELLTAVVGILQSFLPILPELAKVFMELLDAILPILPPLLDLVILILPPLTKLITLLLDPVTRLIGLLAKVIGFVARFEAGLVLLYYKALEPIIGVLADVVKAVARFVAGFNKMGWVQAVVRGVSGAFDKVKQAVETAFNWIRDHWKLLVGILLGPIAVVIAPFIIFKDKIIGFFKAVWDGITKGASVAWEKFLRPIFVAIAFGFRLVGAIFEEVWKTLIRPTLLVMQFFFELFWDVIVRPIFFLFQQLWKQTADYFALVWTRVIKPALDGIAAAFQWVWNSVIKPVIGFIQAALKAMGDAFNWMWKNVVQPVMNAIGAAWHAVGDAFQWVWKNLIQPVINAFNTAWKAVGDAFAWVWNNVIKKAWNALQSAFATGWNWIRTQIFDNIDKAWRALGNTFDWVKIHVFDKVWEGIQKGLDGLKKSFETVTGQIGNIWKGIKGAFAQPVKWVLEFAILPLMKGANFLLKKVGSDINTEIGQVEGILKTIQAIPMATGGVVPGGWGGGDRIHALLEPGEWVLTKTQARAIGYGKLSDLPHYAEGGVVSPHWPKPPGWGTIEHVGGAVAGGVGKGLSVVKDVGTGAWKGLADLGEDAVDKATGLIRYAAYQAYEIAIKPIKALLDALPEKTFMFEVVAKFGKFALDAVGKFLKGKSESDEMTGSGSALALNIWNEARKQLGKPYVWGARGPSSFDCSGLWDWSFGTAPGSPKQGWTGARVGPTTNEQSAMGHTISLSQAGIGDLLFFGSPIHHVAGALDPKNMIHAPHTGDVVRIASIYEPPSLIKRLIEPTGPGGGNVKVAPGGGGAVERWRPVVVEAYKLWNIPAADDFINGMLTLIKWESGGNPTAQNNWDSNAQKGIPSGGLCQVIQPTFLANHHPATSLNLFDPLANIASSIKYIAGRYGNVTNLPGYRSVQRGGGWIGYDSGGFLQPGQTMVINNTGKPEPVLNPDQWDAIQAQMDVTRHSTLNSGPAVSIGTAHFADKVDVDMLMARAEFAIKAGRL
jgi:tape measure domain-containing protein